MHIRHLLHPVCGSLANFPTAVLFFLGAWGTRAYWNQSTTFPKWVKVSIKMWLSFDIVYTLAVTWFLSQPPSVTSTNIWTAVISFLWLKKKFKTSREWQKVAQRVYFHLSAQNLRVLASIVAEWGQILPKYYFRLLCLSPIPLFSLSPRGWPGCRNQPNQTSLNQHLD